jgi:hypothetical protein
MSDVMWRSSLFGICELFSMFTLRGKKFRVDRISASQSLRVSCCVTVIAVARNGKKTDLILNGTKQFTFADWWQAKSFPTGGTSHWEKSPRARCHG